MKTYLTIKDEALNHLKKDEAMKELIERVGLIKRESNKDLFSSLVSSIIAQLISTKAANTIKGRLLEKVSLTPEAIYNLEDEELRSIGISLKKAQAIKEISRQVLTGELLLEGLSLLSDEELKERLVKLPSVGPWTAEMLMIFSLERENVLSGLDLGIRRGIERLYQREATKEFISELKEIYAPYGTTASIYLWHLAGE